MSPEAGREPPPPWEDTIDVRSIDWNLVWQARRAGRGSPKRDADFWNGRAASFAKAVEESSFSDRFLTIMNPKSDWSVLDMGCGSGTLAVPLAKSVASVTAVDLSPEMLALTRLRCEAEGIDNVTTLRGRWEDDWKELGLGVYDVALASRSMVADDLRGSVLKLDAAARRRVYIVTLVGDGPFDRRLFEAVGKPLNVGPDYIYNYNMLYQMGILANVAFIDERRNRTYNDPEEAFESVRWMFFDGLNSAEEEKLRAYVRGHLVFRDKGWQFSYDKTVRWAVLWWEKE